MKIRRYQVRDFDDAISALQGYHEDAIDEQEDIVEDLRQQLIDSRDTVLDLNAKIDLLQENLYEAREEIYEMGTGEKR